MSVLQGKVALVTGGSRGIGRAISERLAEDGAFVIINFASNQDAARETIAAIKSRGGQAVSVRADLGSLAGIRALVNDCEQLLKSRFGTAKVDVLVNNAAVCWEQPITEVEEADYDQMMDVNVKGPFFVSKLLLPLIPDGGRIINISSNGAQRAYPLAIGYSTSKHAMTGFTKNLAAALGPRRINVNAVEPGFVPSDMFTSLVNGRARQIGGSGAEEKVRAEMIAGVSAMTAMGRFGEAAEIADAVAFFTSRDSRWVTGQCLAVDGGLLL